MEGSQDRFTIFLVRLTTSNLPTETDWSYPWRQMAYWMGFLGIDFFIFLYFRWNKPNYGEESMSVKQMFLQSLTPSTWARGQYGAQFAPDRVLSGLTHAQWQSKKYQTSDFAIVSFFILPSLEHKLKDGQHDCSPKVKDKASWLGVGCSAGHNSDSNQTTNLLVSVRPALPPVMYNQYITTKIKLNDDSSWNILFIN